MTISGNVACTYHMSWQRSGPRPIRRATSVFVDRHAASLPNLAQVPKGVLEPSARLTVQTVKLGTPDPHHHHPGLLPLSALIGGASGQIPGRWPLRRAGCQSDNEHETISPQSAGRPSFQLSPTRAPLFSNSSPYAPGQNSNTETVVRDVLARRIPSHLAIFT